MSSVEDLQKLRQEAGVEERSQLKLYQKMWLEQRQQFEIAETQLWLSQNKYLSDNCFLQEKIIEWIEKCKDGDARKVVFSNLLKAVYRVDTYVQNIETSNKQSIVLYLQKEKSFKSVASEMNSQKLRFTLKENEYKNKIKQLEEEIRFLEKKQA